MSKLWMPTKDTSRSMHRALLIVGLLAVPLALAACETSQKDRSAGLAEALPASPTASTVQPPGTRQVVAPLPLAAPDFRLPDLGGEAWTLSQFRGRPVMLFYWATW